MKRTCFITALCIIFGLTCRVSADEAKPKSLEAIEFLSGFGKGSLRSKGSYRLIPLIVDFDFDLKPLAKKINLNPSQLLQFQVEPFFSPAFEPKANIEIGTAFFLKFGILPQTSKFQPYVKGGAGLVYMTLQTREQGTQFNFVDQVGVGFHYFFRANTALTLEGRARHLSNAGIDQPNKGIQTYFALLGISYQF